MGLLTGFTIYGEVMSLNISRHFRFKYEGFVRLNKVLYDKALKVTLFFCF